MSPHPRPRRFLFLQGMANWFFARLGAALREGYAVHRVNFNAGDRLFWPHPGAIAYRGRAEDWPDACRRFIADRGITDMILFGDGRPLHRAAIAVAQAAGVAVHVCEEGYIRPGFVTFERDGVNGFSTLPRDPACFRRLAAALPPAPRPVPVPSSFRRRGWEDFAYNAAALALAPLYPHYQTHRPRHRLVEYAGWSWKVLRGPARRHRAASRRRELQRQPPFFLLPLQLEGDYQLRLHAPFPGVAAMIDFVALSFARHAPPGLRLLIKEHPLDDGLVDWRRLVERAAAQAGIADRVTYLEFGDSDALIRGCRGLVTANSTMGTQALAMGVPVIALGSAVYGIPGLTHQAPLDSFWADPTPPDISLVAAFQRVLIDRCLIQGGFYSEPGLRMLVAGALARLQVPFRTGFPAVAAWPAVPA